MSRPKNRPVIQNFSLATEESKRVIAAFQASLPPLGKVTVTKPLRAPLSILRGTAERIHPLPLNGPYLRKTAR